MLCNEIVIIEWSDVKGCDGEVEWYIEKWEGCYQKRELLRMMIPRQDHSYI